MIKYYCDKCGMELLPATKVHVQAIMPDGSKRSLQVCKTHWQDIYRSVLSDKSSNNKQITNVLENNESKDIYWNQNRLTKCGVEKLHELFSKGIEVSQIAEMMGISIQCVRSRKKQWEENKNPNTYI